MKVKNVNKPDADSMKTTVPNSGGGGGKAKDKEAAKLLLEKELEEVTKSLKTLTNTGKDSKKATPSCGNGNELKLWEQKVRLRQ